jgi:multiple sugar transport system permease protein
MVYLFQNAFQFFDMGFASAMAWLLFAIIMIITAIQLKLGNRWVYYEGDRA